MAGGAGSSRVKARWLALAVVLLPSAAAQDLVLEDPLGDVVRSEGLQIPRATGGPLADAVDIGAVFVHQDGGLAFHIRLKDLQAADGSALYPSAQYAVRFKLAGNDGVHQLMAIHSPRTSGESPAWRFGYYDELETWWEADGVVDLESDAVTLKALWPACFGEVGDLQVLSAQAWLHDNPDDGGDHYTDVAGTPDRGATGAAGILGVGPPPCAGVLTSETDQPPVKRPAPATPALLALFLAFAAAVAKRR
jgi:hypothetical protein